MRGPISQIAVITLTVLMVFLGGCAANAPTRFYVLTSLAPLKNTKPAQAVSRPRVVEVGPVELPLYLDSMPILTRISRNEFKLSEFDLWAEPLEDNFSRILVENLSLLMPMDHVVLLPAMGGGDVDLRVKVIVTQFDCNINGDCTLNVRWSVLKNKEGGGVRKKASRFIEHSAKTDHSTMVGSLNKALADFSREIASVIKELH